MSCSETNLLWKKKLKEKENKPQIKVDTLLAPALSHCLGDMVVRMPEVMATIGVLNELTAPLEKANRWPIYSHVRDIDISWFTIISTY